ncbi:MAG: pyridoxal phosphate-dependent aminotransferase [Nitrosotalea sp.]
MRKFIVDQQAEDIETPDNLRLNTFLKKYQSECTHKDCNSGYYGFAFGQSPFPVPKVVQDALKNNTDKGYYAPISGVTELREAISEYNQRYFKLDIDLGRIYVGPGTKELIYNLLEMLHGTIILPTPSWLGYLPQIRLLRKNFHMLPAGANNKINAKSLEHLALRLQDRQKILILNNPHNPTGLLYSRLELEEITDICRNYDLLVISDEIYAQTTYNFKEFVSMGKIYPEGTFVTNGLSKSHAAGGYRLGYVIFPPHTPDIKHQYKKILATEYTATSTPIQYAAMAGFSESKEMDRYFETTRNIHRIVGEYTYNALREIDGVKSTKPEATFYLLADFNHFIDDFHANKIYTSKQFSESLIEHPYHTAIVGGDSLVLERVDFRARLAFVDYDGARAMRSYVSEPPKTSLDKIEFVENNAPRVVAGIKMIERYLGDLQDQAISMAKKRTAQSITFQ